LALATEPYGLGACCLIGSSEDMVCWPASARIGNVKNNDPSLIEPIAAG
jgi:hypothetical protein